MKLKCIKCGEELTPGTEDLKAIVDIIERHNLDVTTFLESLSPIGGKCKDGDVHMYSFDEDFRDTMTKLSKKFDDINKKYETSKNEYEKLIKERKELETKYQNLVKNIGNKLDEIKQLDNELEAVHQECEELTSSRNIKLWK